MPERCGNTLGRGEPGLEAHMPSVSRTTQHGAPVADIYIRESTDAGLQGYSPDEMVRRCREKAAALGADVDRIVVEGGKRDEWDCPGLLETIDRAKAGAIDYVISWDM